MKITKIIAFGDSLTQGVALKKGQSNWTDMLAARLGVEVINKGIGGNTSRQGLARLKGDVLELKPDMVIINFGMNDSIIVDAEGNDYISLSEYESNIREMIEKITDIGAIPVIAVPNGVIEEYYYTRHPIDWYKSVGGAQKQINRYCEKLRDLAREYSIALADINAESLSPARKLSELLRTPDNGGSEDGVHPYGKGIELYAEVIYSAIAKYFM